MTLEQKRQQAIAWLGERWVLHPKHAPTKRHGSTHESMRHLRGGAGPSYSDLRAEARMSDYHMRRIEQCQSF